MGAEREYFPVIHSIHEGRLLDSLEPIVSKTGIIVMQYQARHLERDGLKLHFIDEGAGPAVMLIHGFPDSIHVWRHQIPHLINAGYRVIAADNRGMGQSDAPQSAEVYTLDLISADCIAILDACSVDRVAVVGHDWGAIIGWVLVDQIGQRAGCFTALSVGAPQCYAGCDDIRQKEIGWYTLMFQMEEVAEQMLMADDWRLFRQWARHHAEAEHWIADLSRDGRLTAALNIYRANMLPALTGGVVTTSNVPTLGLWSTGDDYLVEEQVIASGRFVKSDWRYESVDNASHWMMLDRPEHINRLLLNHLSRFHTRS